MTTPLKVLHNRLFRPWDALLIVPLISIFGLMVCIVDGLPSRWLICCVGTSGASIGSYFLVEWLARRPGPRWERRVKRCRRDAVQ